MDFFKQFHGFVSASVGLLHPYSRLIYFVLLEMGNGKGKSEGFYATNASIQLATGIKNEKTMITYRDKLIEHGFIEYKKGAKNRPSSYRLVPIDCIFAVPDTANQQGKENIPCNSYSESAVKATAKTQPIRQTSKSKNKTREDINTPLPPNGGIWEGYTDNPALLAALRDYEDMRKKIKKPMQDSTKKRALLKLDALAQDDETKIAVLNQSIDHNWQGLFELMREGEANGRHTARPSGSYRANQGKITDSSKWDNEESGWHI